MAVYYRMLQWFYNFHILKISKISTPDSNKLTHGEFLNSNIPFSYRSQTSEKKCWIQPLPARKLKKLNLKFLHLLSNKHLQNLFISRLLLYIFSPFLFNPKQTNRTHAQGEGKKAQLQNSAIETKTSLNFFFPHSYKAQINNCRAGGEKHVKNLPERKRGRSAYFRYRHPSLWRHDVSRPALGRPSEQWTVKWRVSNRGTKAAPNLSLRFTGSHLKAPHILIKIQSYRAGGVFWQRNYPPPRPVVLVLYVVIVSPCLTPLLTNVTPAFWLWRSFYVDFGD